MRQESTRQTAGTFKPVPSPVRSPYKADQEILAWVAEQQRQYHEGTLPQSKIQQLERIPGWTWSAGARSAIRHRRIIFSNAASYLRCNATSNWGKQLGGSGL